MILVKDHYDSSRQKGLLFVSLKMWQIDIFIGHNCSGRENIVGHRCVSVFVRESSHLTSLKQISRDHNLCENNVAKTLA